MATRTQESQESLTPIICRLNTASIPQLAAIESLHQPVPWSEKLFLDEFAQNCSMTYGARIGGKLCGYIVFRVIQDEAHILNLCVLPEVRRCGFARALIDRACRVLHQLAAQWCDLEVRVSNRAAQRLYEQCGFSEVGRRKGYYQENGEDAILLRVNLQDYIDERCAP